MPADALAASDRIAFQGHPGAYSHLACAQVFPDRAALPTATFEDTIAAVHDGQAGLAMIPVENSVAGRVADIHHLLPQSGLSIIGEHYLRVNHHLLAPPGATLSGLKRVRSHVMALSQCRGLIRELGLQSIVSADTAGAAEEVAALADPQEAAIASALAGRTHGLVSLRAGIEDAEHNTTRFVIMSRTPRVPEPDQGLIITSFVFRVRNIPAALYKCLGGFATNGVNMTRLESYIEGDRMVAAQFFADVEGHHDTPALQRAFQELAFFCEELRILGIYPGHPYRRLGAAAVADS